MSETSTESKAPERGVVTHVRVYIDRATVTRARRVACTPGVREIRFEGLPLEIETDTLRARARRDEVSVPVVSVSSRIAYAEPSSERREAVQKRIDEVEAKLRATQDAQGSDEHAAELLARYASLASDHLCVDWIDGDPAFDKWNEAFDALRGSHARLAGTSASRAEEVSALLRAKKELVREQLRLGDRPKSGHHATVTLDVPEGEGEIEVELSYVTRAAQWMPSYDARVEGDLAAPTVRWTAVALVKQVTGEDWRDVELVATTARPPLAEPPPELSKMTVSGRAAAPDRDVVARHDAGARLTGAGGGAPAAQAQVEHVAPGRVSVPSTSRPVRVELFEAQMPAKRRLEVAPMTRPVATWVLDLENTTGRVLLPGSVSLFRGPNYSGRTEVGFVSGHERFRLPLATEGGLRIARRTHPRPVKRTAVTGTQTYEYEHETSVENLGPEPVTIWVRDRVPVSRSEKVGVELVRFPKTAELEEETGRFAQPLTVAPGAKEKLEVVYRVTAPRGTNLEPPEQL